MSRIIFFTFSGRTANMEVQRPYVQALLEQNPESELHLWDLTRQKSDQIYVQKWAKSDDRICYMDNFHNGHPIQCRYPRIKRRRGMPPCHCMRCRPPYEKPYQYYAGQTYPDDTVFVKFDDDVIWMDVPKFPEMIEFLETRPKAVVSANVINNAVCAKYDPRIRVSRSKMTGFSHYPEDDIFWWGLHLNPDFARETHEKHLADLATGLDWESQDPVRPRPGEAVSINFIAMKYPTLCKMSKMMHQRLGDEGAVDSLLPWIVPNFRVAHLTFGPQEEGLGHEVDEIRNAYKMLNTTEGDPR